MMHASRRFDVAVIGAGPAGLAIAGACAARGLSVIGAAPDAGASWPRSYGAWRDELEGTPAADCIQRTYEAPRVVLDGEARVLSAAYAKLSTAGLQRALLRGAGCTFRKSSVARIEEHSAGSRLVLDDGTAISATLVVDASGAASRFVAREQGPAPAFQTAFGMTIDVARHPYAEGEMSLMDFTSSGDDCEPTFLYALPLGPTRLFVEETSLVARRPPSLDRLRRSLEARLRRMRIEPLSVRHIERCVIPMGLALPLPRQRIVAFGAAASMVHPATGYQLMRALRTAGTVADAIARALGTSASRSPVGPDAAARAAYHALWPRRDRTAWRLYRFGMDVLTRLSRDDLAAFMRAFFDLPATTWQRYLTGALGPLDIALAMLRMVVVADADTRRQLLACLPLTPGALAAPSAEQARALLPQASMPQAAPRSP